MCIRDSHYNSMDVENASKMIIEALSGIDTAHGHKHEHEHAK